MKRKAIVCVLICFLASMPFLALHVKLSKSSSQPRTSVLNIYFAGEGNLPAIYGDIIAFDTSEEQIGYDLNGDGVVNGTHVVRFYNISSGTLTNTGIEGSFPAIYGDIIAVMEDGSIRYYNITDQTVTDTGRKGWGASIYGDIITSAIGEPLIWYYNMSTKTVVETGLRGFHPQIYEDVIAYYNYSYGEVPCIRYYNISSGKVTDTNVEGVSPHIFKDIIAFTAYDYNDTLEYWNITSEALVNTGIDMGGGYVNSISGNVITFGGEWPPTYNGEIAYYNISSGLVSHAGLFGDGESASYEHIIAFETTESMLGMDLNNDGDMNDSGIAYVSILPLVRVTVSFDPNLLILRNKDQWITVHIEFPEEYNVSPSEVSSVWLNKTIPVDLSYPITTDDYDNDTIPDLAVRFNRTAASEFMLSEGILFGSVTLTVTGELYAARYNTRPFEGYAISKVRMPGDINADGKVDVKDTYIVALAFGESLGRPRWNPIADENEDGRIDVKDYYTVCRNYGKEYFLDCSVS